MLLTMGWGCSSSNTNSVPIDQASGGSTPQDASTFDPSHIFGERLVANPHTDCPENYQNTMPVVGWNRDFSSASQQRAFYLQIPNQYPARDANTEPRTPMPMLIAFHGTNSDGEKFFNKVGLQAFVDAGFLVIAPSSNGNGTVWPVWDAMREEAHANDPNPDLDFFDAVVKCVAAHYVVDARRVYVAGHSAGGMMSNYVLQRRSTLLAGGIVSSGVFSLTQPKEHRALDEMFVLVTWGGPTDGYAGDPATHTPGFNLVEQASMSSTYYAHEPHVRQVNCSANVGHNWLLPINGWMAAMLLKHPKGFPFDHPVAFVGPDIASGVSCSTDAFVQTDQHGVQCEQNAGDNSHCAQVCQFFGDCAVDNGTIGPVLAPQLTAIGFSGPNNHDCGGCVRTCQEKATSNADSLVLSCLTYQHALAQCGPGIEGAKGLVTAINTCCAGHSDSAYCVELCTQLLSNQIAGQFFTTCNDVLHH